MVGKVWSERGLEGVAHRVFVAERLTQGAGAVRAVALMQLGTNEGENVSGGGFEFCRVTLHTTAEIRVEGHGDDTDDEAGSGGDEGFPNSLRELELFGSFDVAVGDFHEGFNHPDDGSEEADHGGNSANVGKVADALGEDAGLAVALGFGYVTDLGLAGVGVFGEEIEGLLGDSCDGLAAAVAIGDEAKVVALADHGLGGVHELIRHHGAASQGEEVKKDEDEGEHREGDESSHDPATFLEDIDQGDVFRDVGDIGDVLGRGEGRNEREGEREQKADLHEVVGWKSNGRFPRCKCRKNRLKWHVAHVGGVDYDFAASDLPANVRTTSPQSAPCAGFP